MLHGCGRAESSLRRLSWSRPALNPEIRYTPAIIRFLGYDPLPKANTLAEQLVRRRTSLGLSQKESAQRIGVDQGTLARWEQGKREPQGEFAKRVEGFLASAEGACAAVARTI